MKVVIAGGGIGGLSAAIALAKVGFEVEVVERAAALTEVGAGIQLFWDMIGLLVLPRPEESSAWSVVLPTTAGDALVSFFFAPFVLLIFLFIGSAISEANPSPKAPNHEVSS